MGTASEGDYFRQTLHCGRKAKISRRYRNPPPSSDHIPTIRQG
jgi:hypothetical protein